MDKNLIKKVAITAFVLALVAPAAFAVDYGPPGQVNLDIYGLLDLVLKIVWAVFIAIAIIMFIVAGITFLAARGEPEGINKARSFALYGVVGVAVAILGWSIVYIIKSTLGA